MRCLIIDDEEAPRQLMEHLVRRAGHKAQAVKCADDAVAALTTQPCDVVIVDMEMPQQSGPTTIGVLRTHFPGLPILVVSGYDDPKHVLAALEAGADGYLVKDELNESLAECLHNVRAGQSPLSPRVAAILIRQLRKAKPASGAAVARMRRLGK